MSEIRITRNVIAHFVVHRDCRPLTEAIISSPEMLDNMINMTSNQREKFHEFANFLFIFPTDTGKRLIRIIHLLSLGADETTIECAKDLPDSEFGALIDMTRGDGLLSILLPFTQP